MDNDSIIISVGGSLIVPGEIDIGFLKAFKSLVLKYAEKGKKFAIVCGGGRTARNYQEAAKVVTKLTKEDVDWLGIRGTELNAHLIKAVFNELARPEIITNPTKKIEFREKVLVAAGWKPGCSTDYDAVLLAKALRTKTLVNLSNVDYVYDKDPRQFKEAKPIKQVPWEQFRKIIPNEWSPGLNAPFDPVASKEAQKLGLEVVIMNGRNIKNLENYLDGKSFIGTRIS